ncbi:glycosyltransferase [Metapseudomonas furukawaii]|uniref:glycosyltransferase n=1 Tax=Metapseudomonas furukawaii TaxID=1149133 RepID=UPI004046582D
MKILHLCSYFIGSKVYKSLFAQLARTSLVSSQCVWIPIRDHRHHGVNSAVAPGVEFQYVHCLGLFTRLLFAFKQVRLFLSFIQSARDGGRFDLIHAHTLYSDGFLAYWLSKKYKIPYVLTVRTTDIGVFERLLPHWRPLTRRVIGNARCLVFVSQAHKMRMEQRYRDVLPRTLLLPNGVDPYWIKHALAVRSSREPGAPQAIYLGAINQNKNIRSAILAFFSVQQHPKSRFRVVGGGYEAFRAVYGDLAPGILSKVDFFEQTQDKGFIRSCLGDSDVLVMPSHMETFGLTYLEAISQCVPVVYSQGQGIDGLFPEGSVGFGCDPDDLGSIAAAIAKTLQAFPGGLRFDEGDNPVAAFSWETRARQLLDHAYR